MPIAEFKSPLQQVDPGAGLVMCHRASTNAYRVTVQATDDGQRPLASQFAYSINMWPLDRC